MDFLCANCYRKDMFSMQFTPPRATLDEVLTFANRVRKAGGGNPLEALMPAVPQSKTQCLIAKNLNFNCRVGGWLSPEGDTHWVMVVEDVEIRDRIAAELDLRPVDFTPSSWNILYDRFLADPETGKHPELHCVILPAEIGEVASEYDRWVSAAVTLRQNKNFVSALERERLKEFTPFVKQSVRETSLNGLINEAGELVL